MILIAFFAFLQSSKTTRIKYFNKDCTFHTYLYLFAIPFMFGIYWI